MTTPDKDQMLLDLVQLGLYHPHHRLTVDELGNIYTQVMDGLATTNGDTAPVTLTVRQVCILFWIACSSIQDVMVPQK